MVTQTTAIPEAIISTASLIDRHHENHAEPPRPHMGCSLLGHPCDRRLWLSFRWAAQEKFSGRMLRLFRRGQNEEAVVVSDLRAIGVDVQATGASQSRVKFDCHVSGSVDGIIESGLPESPKKRHILEIKTYNRKSFDKLTKDGVHKTKFQHYVQMQLYMLGTGIDRAFYIAICKDSDEIYTERIRFDKELAEKYLERGKRLALAERMPEPLSADPSWYQCQYCPAHGMCFAKEPTKCVNCRTCAHSTPKPDSTWRCERHQADGIPVEFQQTGCESHVLHPDVVPWKQKDGLDEWTAVYEIDGRDVANGAPRSCVYSSAELLANPAFCAAGHQFVEAMREQFGGRVV